MLKIDVGCGGKGTRYDGYTGLDIWPVGGITRHPDSYILHDCVRQPLPFESDSVDHAICLHVLEHMNRGEAFCLAMGIHRVLKPGAECIFAVPDLRLMCEKYLANDWEFYSKEGKPGVLVWDGPTLADRLLDSIIGMGPHGHRYGYDQASLKFLLIEHCKFKMPKVHEPVDPMFSKRSDHEVFIRVIK